MNAPTAHLPAPARVREAPVAPAVVPRPRRRTRLSVVRVTSTVLIFVIVVIQAYPLVWIFLTALRPAQEFASGNSFALPTTATLDNFTRAFSEGNILRWLLNSAIITGCADAAIVVLGMMASYAITVLGFRYSRFVSGFLLIGIIVPVQVALVPLFINYSNLGLLNSYTSMVLPLVGFGLPISVYLFSSFYSFIPAEMYEAASLDGAGPYRIFAKITLPLSINTVITVVFMNSIFIWNDFVFANTFVLTDSMKTVPLGLQSYLGTMGSIDWTATFAAVATTLTPLLLVFFALNKTIIYGLESGGTKG